MRPARDPAPLPAQQAGCTLLVLRSLDEPLAKRYTLGDDGKVVKHAYQNAYRFMPDPVHVSNLHDLHRLIKRLERDPYCCIVRGELANPSQWRIKREPIRRLLHPSTNKVTGEVEAAALCAHPQGQPWLMVDMDGIPTPDGMDVAGDPLSAVRYARALLPDWLADTECVYQWSASAGVDGFATLRLHLFFWLSERRPDLSLERYFTRLLTEQGLPVDPSVCRPVQIHYTSAPILDEGVKPFLPFTRTGLLAGSTKLAHPPREILHAHALLAQLREAQLVRRLNQDRRAAQQALGLVQTPHSKRLKAYARGALIHSADRLRAAPVGLRHATLLREALGLARLVGADLLDEDEVLELLHTVGSQILADRSDPTHEIEDIWAWAHPRGVTSPFQADELEELEPKKDARAGANDFVDAWREVTPVDLATGREAVRSLIAHGVRVGGGHCVAASPSLGKSFAAIEEAILPLAIQGGKVKLLLPSNNLLDEKRCEILTHADRWLDQGKIAAADYNDLVDLIQKFPTRNYENCENFKGYQAADRVQQGGGKRYCHICSKREECESLGFLKQAKEAHNARILLTTPHLEAQLTGQHLPLWQPDSVHGAEDDREIRALAMQHTGVVVLWQKIAEQIALHNGRFIPHTHRTPTRIEVSIRPAARGGALLPGELEEHISILAPEEDDAPHDAASSLSDDGEDEALYGLPDGDQATTRYRISATGREILRSWLIAQHGGWGSARDELVSLYQNPDSWEWDALIIDEDPTGAMHVTLEATCHQIVHLFASGQLVASLGAEAALTRALMEDQGEAALARCLASHRFHAGLYDATVSPSDMARLLGASARGTNTSYSYLERLTELLVSKHALEAESLCGAMGPAPERFDWDELLLEQHGLLPLARLLERCARAGFASCRVTRAGLVLHVASPAEDAWARICKAGHPARMLEIANSLPDWRVAPALIAASQPSDGTAFEGCWVHKGSLHIPQIRRIDTTQARCVLYLDGTADPVTAQAVVPDCHWHPVVLQRPSDMEVVQVQLCATWQKITESKPMMRRWAMVHALAELSHPGATLHITHKRLNQQVERELNAQELADMPSASARRLLGALASPAQIIHHGSSLARGSNQWEQARCVVLDAWRVPQHAVAERARVLARLAGVSREQALASARFALEGQGVIQEIHRARPLLGNTTIFVLDDRELPGLAPDHVWSLDMLDMRVYQLTGHLPHHHTFVTTELVRQAVHRQGGLVLGDALLDIDEAGLIHDAWLREGLSGGFAKILLEELPPSPSRLSQTVRHLVDERLSGSWTRLAQALELECVRVRSSLQNREVLLLMPPEHTASDVLRLMGTVPGWSWCAFGEEYHSKDDPAALLDGWLSSVAHVRWDVLPGQLARSVLVRTAREAGHDASHPRLAWAMRALGLGIAGLRERWRALHGIPAQQTLSFEESYAHQNVVQQDEHVVEQELLARLDAKSDTPVVPLGRLAQAQLALYKLNICKENINIVSATRYEEGWQLEPLGLDEDINLVKASAYAGQTPVLEYAYRDSKK